MAIDLLTGPKTSYKSKSMQKLSSYVWPCDQPSASKFIKNCQNLIRDILVTSAVILFVAIDMTFKNKPV